MKLNIIKWRRVWWLISLTVIISSIVGIIISYSKFNAPLKLGLDFVGGTRLQLQLECETEKKCTVPIDTKIVRDILTTRDLNDNTIQVLENNILSIQTKPLDVEQRTELQKELNDRVGSFNFETIQIDTVGPTIGLELFKSGILALLASFLGIVFYLSIRFKIDYAFFAILALVHDVLITVGFFSYLGLFSSVEVNSLFLVSLLTIIGFSVNDTVVIYDRIRENIDRFGEELSLSEIVNNSVNQTLSRSINTTATTLLPLLSLFLFGGETIKFFALALILGFSVGSYSSIFIASTLLAWWRESEVSNIKLKS
ncbi:MAG: protein translocase subunit secF [Candidatus Atelocyanobacterium thalassa isolate SIO64986]|uniref:Protein-export membrane protein SecF n=1 Tax=Candidatus Atelocyanobacterium thalassa isolate SIO64986 TaxID=1527444 RepID=A0A086CFV8_9CHRO|nr:MAG: protein translocase subunit secF [Candidatus Atelocyanobacterium thalassa isolate SIO64986]